MIPEQSNQQHSFMLRLLVLLPVGLSVCYMVSVWLGWATGLLLAVSVCILVTPVGTVLKRVVVSVIVCVLIALLLPAIAAFNAVNRPSQCTNRLKQIALAMHNYHDVYKCFPPAYVADEDGKPMHSWRVLILPYNEQQTLYDQYDFDEPWNGPNNSLLHDQVLEIYRCDSNDKQAGALTNYVAITGPGTVFPGDRSVSMDEVTDGTDATILVVETCDSNIHWMEPRDLDVRSLHLAVNPGEGMPGCISSNHPGGVNAACVDGSVRFLSNSLSAKTLRGMLTIAGGEIVDWDGY